MEPADTVVAVGHTIPFVWDGAPDDLPPTMAGLMDRGVRTRRNRDTPNALQPVTIDRERDEGRYEDPNVWMRHPITAVEPGR